MDHFTYRDGALFAEDVPAASIADAAQTPCYVYSRQTIVDHYRKLEAAFAELDPLLCFAVKSCSNLSILRLLAECGAGMDLVSGGELHRAQHAGVQASRCVFAGVGKTDREIAEAIRAGIGWFNVESEAEFEAIRRVAAQLEQPCRAALRVNPDVDPKTHEYTTTGLRRTKFGVDHDRALDFFKRFGNDAWCKLSGIHLHIGSPVYSVEPYVKSIHRAVGLIDALAEHGVTIEMLDLGGGFGADYESGRSPTASDYAEQIVPLLRDRVANGLQIILEPGRTIAANAGVLLTRVLYRKQSGDKTFLICDAGMHTLLRPSHYDAFHFIWPVTTNSVPPQRAEAPDVEGLEHVDVVGPICETGDFLARDRAMPAVAQGQLLAVFAAGAYGMSMASRYNSMPLPAEVLVDGTRLELIRRRETYHDLIEHESSEAMTWSPSVETPSRTGLPSPAGDPT